MKASGVVDSRVCLRQHRPVPAGTRRDASTIFLTLTGLCFSGDRVPASELRLVILVSRKRRISPAITRWSSSSAKCPVSSRWNSRSFRSLYTGGRLPPGRFDRSCPTRSASVAVVPERYACYPHSAKDSIRSRRKVAAGCLCCLDDPTQLTDRLANCPDRLRLADTMRTATSSRRARGISAALRRLPRCGHSNTP